MNIHVLPGDALTENFNKSRIDGETVVCRECLVEGDVKARNLNDFWNVRADFLKSTYGENKEKYSETVVSEFRKLSNLAAGAEINLWFEYELFCQTNMWFCLDLLSETKADIYRVAPVVGTKENVWDGFGKMNAEDLRECFAGKIKFEKEDITLGANLWKAYQNSDYEKLEQLSQAKSDCFPFLEEVCRAEIEKNSRPKKILRQIVKSGATDFFGEIFPEFSRRAGVYGFGDAQVKRILQEI